MLISRKIAKISILEFIEGLRVWGWLVIKKARRLYATLRNSWRGSALNWVPLPDLSNDAVPYVAIIRIRNCRGIASTNNSITLPGTISVFLPNKFLLTKSVVKLAAFLEILRWFFVKTHWFLGWLNFPTQNPCPVFDNLLLKQSISSLTNSHFSLHVWKIMVLSKRLDSLLSSSMSSFWAILGIYVWMDQFRRHHYQTIPNARNCSILERLLCTDYLCPIDSSIFFCSQYLFSAVHCFILLGPFH